MLIANILYDVNGNFQWASIAAMVALLASVISAGISIWNNNRTLKNQKLLNEQNIKSNIVSKSRIEWIQEVRKKSVDFISACYNLDFYKRTRISHIPPTDSDKLEYTNIIRDIEKNGTLLILYFGPDSNNKNNEIIVYLVEYIMERTVNKSGYYGKFDISDFIEILKDFLRIYFKAEWKRANGELEDSKAVQSYLEKHSLYNNIYEFCKDGHEAHDEKKEVFYRYMKREYEMKSL